MMEEDEDLVNTGIGVIENDQTETTDGPRTVTNPSVFNQARIHSSI